MFQLGEILMIVIQIHIIAQAALVKTALTLMFSLVFISDSR